MSITSFDIKKLGWTKIFVSSKIGDLSPEKVSTVDCTCIERASTYAQRPADVAKELRLIDSIRRLVIRAHLPKDAIICS